MANDHSRFLGPAYSATLRLIVARGLGTPGAVPRDAAPGGTIPERIRDTPGHSGATVTCRSVAGTPDNAEEVQAEQYWLRAMPHRMLVIGPLSDLADLETNTSRRESIERRILAAYRDDYLSVPLPNDVLELIRLNEVRRPGDEIAQWLEDARVSILSAPTAGEAKRRRVRYRADAVQRCLEGACSELGTSLAELVLDVFTLCLGVRIDVDRASECARSHGGSVALAMKALADGGETTFERVLPSLLHTGVTLDDFSPAEHGAVLAFSGRRRPVAWETFLEPPVRTDDALAPVEPAPKRPAPRVEQAPEPEPVRETVEPTTRYRELTTRLEERILRPELCRRLALIGLGHELGLTQRVLLCGTTGSGKSHSAKALAEVLERPFLQIDMADATATGWKGLDIPDVLDVLAGRAGRTLEGAVLVLNEVDKVRIEPGTEGNSLQAQAQLQASMLGLIDGDVVTSEQGGGRQFDTSKLLVLATGAFGGRFVSDPPTTDDLIRWGWIPELAARWGERICLPPPTRSEGRDLLERSERSVARHFGPLTKALGIDLIVPPEVLGYVVDLWFRSDTDFRSASEWLLAAARSRLLKVLERGKETKVVLTPDDIVVSARSRLRRDGSS